MLGTVTSKGQITLPKKIRERLGLKAGDRIIFIINDEGRLEIQPKAVDTLSLAGRLKAKTQMKLTIEEIAEATGRGAVESQDLTDE